MSDRRLAACDAACLISPPFFFRSGYDGDCSSFSSGLVFEKCNARAFVLFLFQPECVEIHLNSISLKAPTTWAWCLGLGGVDSCWDSGTECGGRADWTFIPRFFRDFFSIFYYKKRFLRYSNHCVVSTLPWIQWILIIFLMKATKIIAGGATVLWYGIYGDDTICYDWFIVTFLTESYFCVLRQLRSRNAQNGSSRKITQTAQTH